MGIVWYIPYYGEMQNLYHQPYVAEPRAHLMSAIIDGTEQATGFLGGSSATVYLSRFLGESLVTVYLSLSISLCGLD